MVFYTYVLISKRDGSFYIGSTTNLQRRLLEHNSGKSPYTSKKKPWDIFYFEEFNTKRESLQREKFLKKQRNRDFYLGLVYRKQNA